MYERLDMARIIKDIRRERQVNAVLASIKNTGQPAFLRRNDAMIGHVLVRIENDPLRMQFTIVADCCNSASCAFAYVSHKELARSRDPDEVCTFLLRRIDDVLAELRHAAAHDTHPTTENGSETRTAYLMLGGPANGRKMKITTGYPAIDIPCQNQNVNDPCEPYTFRVASYNRTTLVSGALTEIVYIYSETTRHEATLLWSEFRLL